MHSPAPAPAPGDYAPSPELRALLDGLPDCIAAVQDSPPAQLKKKSGGGGKSSSSSLLAAAQPSQNPSSGELTHALQSAEVASAPMLQPPPPPPPRSESRPPRSSSPVPLSTLAAKEPPPGRLLGPGTAEPTLPPQPPKPPARLVLDVPPEAVEPLKALLLAALSQLGGTVPATATAGATAAATCGAEHSAGAKTSTMSPGASSTASTATSSTLVAPESTAIVPAAVVPAAMVPKRRNVILKPPTKDAPAAADGAPRTEKSACLMKTQKTLGNLARHMRRSHGEEGDDSGAPLKAKPAGALGLLATAKAAQEREKEEAEERAGASDYKLAVPTKVTRFRPHALCRLHVVCQSPCGLRTSSPHVHAVCNLILPTHVRPRRPLPVPPGTAHHEFERHQADARRPEARAVPLPQVHRPERRRQGMGTRSTPPRARALNALALFALTNVCVCCVCAGVYAPCACPFRSSMRRSWSGPSIRRRLSIRTGGRGEGSARMSRRSQAARVRSRRSLGPRQGAPREGRSKAQLAHSALALLSHRPLCGRPPPRQANREPRHQGGREPRHQAAPALQTGPKAPWHMSTLWATKCSPRLRRARTPTTSARTATAIHRDS